MAGLAILGKVPVRYNVRNLQVRWRTTLMTALAFTLVIALNTVMLAFVNGMYKLTQGSGQPGNVMVLSEGSTDEAFSNLGFSDIGDIELQPGVLRDEANQPLASRETYVVVNQPVRVRAAGPAAGPVHAGPRRRRRGDCRPASTACSSTTAASGSRAKESARSARGRRRSRRSSARAWPASSAATARRRSWPRRRTPSGWTWARPFRSAGGRGSSSA